MSAYKPALFDKLVPSKGSNAKRTIVFIVCGGFKITLDDIATYQSVVNKDVEQGDGWWEVLCHDDHKFKVEK